MERIFYLLLAFVITGLILIISGSIIKYYAETDDQKRFGNVLLTAGLYIMPIIPP